MADLAEIGIKVDSSQVKAARDELGRFAKQGATAKKAADSLSSSTNKLSRAKTAITSGISRVNSGYSKFTKSAKNARDSVLDFRNALVGLAGFFAARAIVNATLQMESINSSLVVATGSAEGAAKEFEFLRNEADRLGLDLRTSADAFSSLAAAAKGTALEGQGARDIFTGVSEAMTALGRDSFATERALRAIEQMISKGNVSAEELRGQLGEALPGAFQLAARSMGVTTQELNKMLDNGELLASDLLPRMATELNNTFGEQATAKARGLQAEINRFKTAVFELMSSGNMTGLADAVRDFTSLISDPNFQTSFSNLLSGLVKLAELSGRVAAGFADFGTWIGESIARLQGYEDVADRVKRLQEELNEELAKPLQSRSISGRRDNSRIAQLQEELALYDMIENASTGQPVTAPQAASVVPLTPRTTVSSGGGGGTSKPDLGNVINFPAPEEYTERNLIMERYNELLEESERIAQSVKTPQEIFQEEIKLLNELRETTNITNGQRLLSTEQYVAAVTAAQDRLSQSTQETATEMSEFMKEAAGQIQNVLADNLFDFMQGEFDFTGDSFKRMIDRMVADAAAAKIAETLFGGLVGGEAGSGLIEKGISAVSGFFGFGGARANGGPVAAGESYMVGERGPELFTPKQSGNITPNSQSGGSMTINVNISGVRDGRDIRQSADQAAMKLMAAGQRAMQRNG